METKFRVKQTNGKWEMSDLITACPDCKKELTENEIILEMCDECGWMP